MTRASRRWPRAAGYAAWVHQSPPVDQVFGAFRDRADVGALATSVSVPERTDSGELPPPIREPIGERRRVQARQEVLALKLAKQRLQRFKDVLGTRVCDARARRLRIGSAQLPSPVQMRLEHLTVDRLQVVET